MLRELLLSLSSAMNAPHAGGIGRKLPGKRLWWQLISVKLDQKERLMHMVDTIQVALWEPEIPPNTGNIARLCAATATPLHLIGRLGFRLDDRELRRAGLDYWSSVTMLHHDNYADFEATQTRDKIICIETSAALTYADITYQPGDCLLFGNESSGLPASILARYPGRVARIPMLTQSVRSLNLANSVAIVVYEALRQLHAW